MNIKSKSKHVRKYGKISKREMKNFPNYILAKLNPSSPFQMDLFNNEIIAYYLSNIRGYPESYLIALEEVLIKKEVYKDFVTILHTDQGSVYSSKRFNESLPSYNIIHSMSKPGTSTENGAMEDINVWIKEELFIDFKLNSSNDIISEIDNYIHYFNYERPQSVLNYLTPMQYKERFNIPSQLSTFT